MPYDYNKHAMIDGKIYGPTAGGRYYQPADYHCKVKDNNKKGRKAKNKQQEVKTHWVRTKSEQYDVFLEGEKVGEVAEMVFSDRVRKAIPYEDMEGKGRILSGATIPKGCVIEFFNKILLQKDNSVQIIDEGAAVKVRTFMSSIRYQDLLSVTMEDHVTIHAIDTLDLDRELTPQIHHNVKPVDLLEQNPPQNDVHFDVFKEDLDLPF